MITDVEDYFTKGCGRCDRFDTADCSTKPFIEGLLHLRKICNDLGLVECVKWGQPCYAFAERNIVVFGALRNDFRLSFFHPGLMKDPHNVLKPIGPNSSENAMIRFSRSKQVAELETIIIEYIKEAKDYAQRGVKAIKREQELLLPDELVDALDSDVELAEAFYALTAGRQKSYVINLNGAKKSVTKVARILKFREKILQGKGANEY